MSAHQISDPFPLDHIGPALRELDGAVTALARISETQPLRLHGDVALIDGALIQLQLIRQRVQAAAPLAAA